ncbi:hypothetical protein D3C85_1652840 [compost metagenome]
MTDFSDCLECAAKLSFKGVDLQFVYATFIATLLDTLGHFTSKVCVFFVLISSTVLLHVELAKSRATFTHAEHSRKGVHLSAFYNTGYTVLA